MSINANWDVNGHLFTRHWTEPPTNFTQASEHQWLSITYNLSHLQTSDPEMKGSVSHHHFSGKHCSLESLTPKQFSDSLLALTACISEPDKADFH